jgi:hypothetical protein
MTLFLSLVFVHLLGKVTESVVSLTYSLRTAHQLPVTLGVLNDECQAGDLSGFGLCTML